jgi:hypothetical protein
MHNFFSQLMSRSMCRDGDFMKRHFRQIRNDQSMVIEISAPDDSYRPTKRDLILETWLKREPNSVARQFGNATESETLPRLNSADLAGSSKGWSYTDDLVTIKDNDRFEGLKLTIHVERSGEFCRHECREFSVAILSNHKPLMSTSTMVN